MKIELDSYQITSRILLGADLKITFTNPNNRTDRKVLELKEVAGFIDATNVARQIQTLRIDDDGGGSSYNFDLSLRLQRKEVNNFPEVLIFIDKGCTDVCFRAVAREIEFRAWTEQDKWLP